MARHRVFNKAGRRKPDSKWLPKSERVKRTYCQLGIRPIPEPVWEDASEAKPAERTGTQPALQPVKFAAPTAIPRVTDTCDDSKWRRLSKPAKRKIDPTACDRKARFWREVK